MSKQTDNAIEDALYLSNYKPLNYPSVLMTVDLAIFTVLENQLKLMTVTRTQSPHKGKIALPGGFIHQDTDMNLDMTASRILFEKTGIRLAPTSPYLEQISSIGSPTRDPRGWSCTVLYFALIPPEAAPLAQAQWLNAHKLSTSLAFDHEELLKLALTRMRNKTTYSTLPAGLMPEKFTLSELQQVFELLIGRTIQNKSFRRRIMESNTIEPTGETKISGKRPAHLYRLSKLKESSHLFSNSLVI
jgi:8-oxo-dGTP diphosphatase